MFRVLIAVTLLLPLASGPAQAHCAAMRAGAALAISPDGTQAVSGSFDTSAIRWSLARNAAEQVLRFHDGVVNAVVFLRDGRIATKGGDAHRDLAAGRAAAGDGADGTRGAGGGASRSRPTERRSHPRRGTTPRGCGLPLAVRRA